MKKLLIRGADTAGTMVANRMRRLLDADEWNITIVDQQGARRSSANSAGGQHQHEDEYDGGAGQPGHSQHHGLEEE